MWRSVITGTIVFLIGPTLLWSQENAPSSWPESEEAVIAAPLHHEVLYEDEMYPA